LIWNLIRVIDFLPFFYALGVLTMFFEKKSRRLRDLIAGTAVIHDRAAGEVHLESATVDQPQAAAAFNVSRLEPEMLAIIEALSRSASRSNTGRASVPENNSLRLSGTRRESRKRSRV